MVELASTNLVARRGVAEAFAVEQGRALELLAVFVHPAAEAVGLEALHLLRERPEPADVNGDVAANLIWRVPVPGSALGVQGQRADAGWRSGRHRRQAPSGAVLGAQARQPTRIRSVQVPEQAAGSPTRSCWRSSIQRHPRTFLPS